MILTDRAKSLTEMQEQDLHAYPNLAAFFYRTLKPGGTAVVNCWELVTWFPPMKTVHETLRPGKPYPAPPINWFDGQQIQKVMLEAGFSKDTLRVEKSEAWSRNKDLKAWAEKTWAFLGFIGQWQESDEERWDEAVELLSKLLLEQPGTKVVDGEVWMKASQWVVIATK